MVHLYVQSVPFSMHIYATATIMLLTIAFNFESNIVEKMFKTFFKTLFHFKAIISKIASK